MPNDVDDTMYYGGLTEAQHKLHRLSLYRRLELASVAIETWGALRLCVFGLLPLIGVNAQFGFFLRQVQGTPRLMMCASLLIVGIIHFYAIFAPIRTTHIQLRKACLVVELVIMNSTLYDYGMAHQWSLVAALLHQFVYQVIALRRRVY